MKRVFSIVSACALFALFGCSDSSDQESLECSRDADEASRVHTAQALLSMNAGNYASLINYWAEDIVYKEPV